MASEKVNSAKKTKTNTEKTDITKKSSTKKNSPKKVSNRSTEQKTSKKTTTSKVTPKKEIKKKNEVKIIKQKQQVVENNENKKAKAIPSTLLGLELPIGATKEDKKARCVYYLKDALLFAIIVPIVDLFAMIFVEKVNFLPITHIETLNYALTMLIDFVLIFALTFLIDYVFAESKIKRINNEK